MQAGPSYFHQKDLLSSTAAVYPSDQECTFYVKYFSNRRQPLQLIGT